MDFREFLSRNRQNVREKWHQLILETYPDETVVFLRKKKDRFDNPIGHAISETVDSVLQCLIDGAGREEFSASLHPLIKIRAVQDFPPSRAVSFVLLLKQAVKEAMAEAGKEAGGPEVTSGLDSSVEEMALVSFDIYTKCREALHRVREDEMKRNLYMLLRKANVFEA